ncbi:MAG TPA: hypothetical protein DCQ29_08200 [Chitinophagaceae bacterium]|nr:hypothetical protein [Chitinophagaceae bacterium]
MNPTLLYISFYSPYPLKSGGAVRSFYTIKALQASFNVKLICLCAPDVYNKYIADKIPQATAAALGVAYEDVVFTLNPINISYLQRVQQTGGLLRYKIDYKRFAHEAALQALITSYVKAWEPAVLCFRHFYIANRVQLQQFNAKVWVDMDDDPFEILATRYQHRWMLRRWAEHAYKMSFLKRFYRSHYQNTTLIFAKAPLPFWADMAPYVIPNIVPEPHFNKEVLAGAAPAMAFIGSMSYPPNIEAVDFLLHRVWPLVLAHIPNAQLLLVGKEMSQQQQQAYSTYPQVQVVGEVPNMIAIYTQVQLTIAPMFSGSGTNIKIIESFAFKTPCVTTSFGLSGLELLFQTISQHLVANTASHLAERVIALLGNPTLLAQVSTIGYQQYTAYHTVAAMEKSIGHLRANDTQS